MIPDSVVEIGDFAFSGCSSLNEVKLSDKLTSIGFGVFQECKNLTSIQIPNSVSNIGNKVFLGCTSLKSVELSNNITKIGWSAFEECSSLTNVVIPENVTEIGDRAFYNCDKLTNIVLPEGLNTIGDYVFYSCDSLTSITFLNSATEIEKYAFLGCKNIEDIYYAGTKDQWTALGEYAPSAKYIHYSSVNAENHWQLKTVVPTCTSVGYTFETCACGYERNKVEDGGMAGHDWSEWNVVKEPTYDEDGVEARSCRNCGEKESRPVEKLEKPVIVNPFTDVSEDQYYYEAVLWAVGRDITNCTTPTTFSPDATCTRGQIVTFLWRAMGKPEPTTTKNPFTDVEKDQYYYKPVLWAVEEGITTGTSATTFAPAKDCTRGQVVTFLYRAVG